MKGDKGEKGEKGDQFEKGDQGEKGWSEKGRSRRVKGRFAKMDL